MKIIIGKAPFPHLHAGRKLKSQEIGRMDPKSNMSSSSADNPGQDRKKAAQKSSVFKLDIMF